MSIVYKIKKGKDISLVGVAERQILAEVTPTSVALKPADFRSLVAKLVVKSGDEVKVGDTLFYDKNNPSVKFTSPVSGEVAEIVRGDRRAIMEVRVLADSSQSFKSFSTNDSSKEAIKETILDSGLWPFIVERPFGIVADPSNTPKAIHISGFDSNPLSADYSFILEGDSEAFIKGVDILSHLTEGNVNLNLSKNHQHPSFFEQTKATVNMFDGPHPAGLVGVQIHHIDPINKGDIVWTISPQAVVYIGRLFNTGQLDLSKTVCVAGSEVKVPGYVKTIHGASVEQIAKDYINMDNTRLISGSIFTGSQIAANGYLGFFDNGLIAIPEGNEYEFLGWLLPSYPRPTMSNSLPVFKFLKNKFKVNTNYHGEERAFVVSGQYEKVLPMDIMPVQLLKAIMAQDFEAIENLGIYEVVEEDLALCEFVCTSKIEVQEILSSGIKLMEEEG